MCRSLNTELTVIIGLVQIGTDLTNPRGAVIIFWMEVSFEFSIFFQFHNLVQFLPVFIIFFNHLSTKLCYSIITYKLLNNKDNLM